MPAWPGTGVALLLAATGTPDHASEWQALLQAKDVAAASERCTAWLEAPDLATRAEAHKCLANVEIAAAAGKAKAAASEGKPEADLVSAALRRAVEHLDAAIELAPGDLTIHQGRLHLLRMAGLLSAMVKALEDSIRRHPAEDWLSAWMAYAREYYEAQRFEQALVLYRVLDRHFPNDHRILSNMGASLVMLKRDDEALACFTQAVKLAPADPVDNWNLARMYDLTGKLDLAEKQYQRALSLKPDEPARMNGTCIFAEFLEKKRMAWERACELQRKAACREQTACGRVRR